MIGGHWLVWTLDRVAPSRMVCVFASVNLPLHHKVQKFSSGTGWLGWSRKKGHKTVVVAVCIFLQRRLCLSVRLIGVSVKNDVLMSIWIIYIALVVFCDWQLVGQYDIVINCTGFGSKELISDNQLVPNRGHLVSVCSPRCVQLCSVLLVHLLTYCRQCFDGVGWASERASSL